MGILHFSLRIFFSLTWNSGFPGLLYKMCKMLIHRVEVSKFTFFSTILPRLIHELDECNLDLLRSFDFTWIMSAERWKFVISNYAESKLKQRKKISTIKWPTSSGKNRINQYLIWQCFCLCDIFMESREIWDLWSRTLTRRIENQRNRFHVTWRFLICDDWNWSRVSSG